MSLLRIELLVVYINSFGSFRRVMGRPMRPTPKPKVGVIGPTHQARRRRGERLGTPSVATQLMFKSERTSVYSSYPSFSAVCLENWLDEIIFCSQVLMLGRI
ncbi:hypothetical protein D1007_32887 [Hordeum vulgare]|nr:hypothetical protein D1007_32887 [Hordeum vulgare]